LGENASQKQDDHIGGRKLISPVEQKFKSGFTDASEEPVIYAVSVAGKRLTATEASGYNPLSTGMDEPGNLEEHYKGGCERLFPMGPTCILQGKEVPTFVCCTDNGSITRSLLAAVIKIIDDIGVFPHNELLPDPPP
jgi:hypothetical protein